MKIGFQPLKRLLPETTQPSKLETMYTSKTNNQANGIWSGDPDTGLFVLSAMDIASTLKIKPQERHSPATSQISFLNLLLSSGMLTPRLAEPVAILTIHPTYPQYNSLILPIKYSHHTSYSSYHCITLDSHLHYSLVLIFTPVINTSQTEPGESVISQPVLQAYPTRHSWIITAHISLGNLDCLSKLFKRQLTRTQQFLRSLEQHPSASTQLLTTLQLEFSNIQDIYKSSEPTIISTVNLLNSNQPPTITPCKRSLLPFLGTALSWLTGTATTKDIHSIKTRINQLIAMQSSQCNTLIHIISILNVTWYATQVNRHSINNLIDAHNHPGYQ